MRQVVARTVGQEWNGNIALLKQGDITPFKTNIDSTKSIFIELDALSVSLSLRLTRFAAAGPAASNKVYMYVCLKSKNVFFTHPSEEILDLHCMCHME